MISFFGIISFGLEFGKFFCFILRSFFQLFPNIFIDFRNEYIGEYGRLILNYLKNFDIHFYTDLFISCTLKLLLLDIDSYASNKVNLLIKIFVENENVKELLQEHLL